MSKISEKQMERGVARYFESQNMVVNKQVPFTQKKIDIVLRNQQELWSIEIKIHDWKSALRQASQNKIAFNCSFVAVWYEFAHRAINNRDLFESMGIGLMTINKDFSANIEFSPSDEYTHYLSPVAHGYILDKIKV